MFKIGEFSKLSQISIRMLRFYDDHDLLKPVYTDPFNNYRYYDINQLEVAEKINELKTLGFKIDHIREILNSSSERYKELLIQKRDELLKDKDSIMSKLKLIDYTLENNERLEMSFTINLKTIPAKKIAAIRKTIPNYQSEGLIFEELFSQLKTVDKIKTNPSFLGIIYHDNEYKENDIDVEAFTEVLEPEKTDKITLKEFPEQEVVSCLIKGSYSQFPKAHKEIGKWIEDNNYQIIGPSFNVYYISPADTNEEDKFLTESCFPVKKN